MIQKLFQKISGHSRVRNPVIPEIYKAKYALFRVDDEQVAQAIRDWQEEWHEAIAIIREYVRVTFARSLAKIDCTDFMVDGDGRLFRVFFNGRHAPAGWAGVPETNWMQFTDENEYNWYSPEVFEQAVQQYKALPCAPTKKSLHDMLNWPTFGRDPLRRLNESGLRRLNNMVQIVQHKGEVFVKCPRPENFEGFKDIKDAIQNWEKPAWLTRVDSVRDIRNDRDTLEF